MEAAPLPVDSGDKSVQNDRIIPRVIEQEMKQSYLDYAMSVIVGRALPDVRDGLKPVHRRILFAMHEAGQLHNKPYKKSAHIVGRVLGELHPHGDMAVYDTMVRMAQDFSLRYPLMDGHGNWGCFTGDTKIKLTDGRSLSFLELIKEHKEEKKNYTYTFNHDTNRIEIAEIQHPRCTKKQAKIMTIVLDNGEKIRCTPNHKFMLRDGTYQEAKHLQSGNSLMPGYFKLSTKQDNPDMAGYLLAHQPITGTWSWVHHLSDEWNVRHGFSVLTKGTVRHHADFNKINNNPKNIKRLGWKEHWHLHADMASWRHRNDPTYVEKLAKGRNEYIEKNRHLLSEHVRNLNAKLWKSSTFREEHQKRIKQKWLDGAFKEHMRVISQKTLKKTWQKLAYQKMMSALKSKEMRERWTNPAYRAFWHEKTKEISAKLWANPIHRIHISSLQKERMRKPEIRQKQSEQSKKLWKKPEYRAHYAPDHFSRMAKKLWNDPTIKETYRKKARQQWQNPVFRQQMSQKSRQHMRTIIEAHPNHMKKLAEKAGLSLREKWKEPSYKKKVMRTKIIKYLRNLMKKHDLITPEKYEQERTNNGIPRLSKAVSYFNSFDEMKEEAEVYNHAVAEVVFPNCHADVYDLTIEGTHNFLLDAGIFVHNSIDGDNAAAYRYTEVRLKKIAEELLADLDKDTVDFQPNFDGSLKEPTVLPGKLPNLLINGSSGIAVGMATNVPPHNITEVIDGTIALIDRPELSVGELMHFIKAPDFPTGALISGTAGIREAYETGHGKAIMKAKAEIVELKGRNAIIVTEIPYMINKSQLIEEIATLVRDKRIIGISDIRDESNKEGIRVVFELKKDAQPKVVLNQLYTFSRLTSTFGINMLALVNNEPIVLNLKQLVQHYISYRQIVVRRRTAFELRKAEERKHILEGLIIALNNIDEVVRKIKASKTVEDAQFMLVHDYALSDIQAKAILDLRLQKLASLEQEKIKQEHTDLLKTITELQSILASEPRIFGIIKEELAKLRQEYGDERRTIIEHGGDDDEMPIEAIIKKEDVVVTISHKGYVKRTPLTEYKSQSRGGIGVKAAETGDDDYVEDLFVASTHSYLLVFTNQGRVYWLKVHELPEASRQARGKAFVNLIQFLPNESFKTIVPVKEFDDQHFVVFATKNGTVKKTNLIELSRPRANGVAAIDVAEDELVNVLVTDGKQQIMIATANGNAVRFDENNVRPMGRTAAGVRGIELRDDAGKIIDEVIGMILVDEKKSVLTITENGYGKRTAVDEYRLIRRGGSGVINIQTSERNGKVVSVDSVTDEDEVIVISQDGTMIRIPCKDISTIGRNTQGVRVMKLREGDKVVSATKVAKE